MNKVQEPGSNSVLSRSQYLKKSPIIRTGFTFIELIISLSLLGVFAVIINQMLMNVGRISWDSNHELLAFRTTSVVTDHLRKRMNTTFSSVGLQTAISRLNAGSPDSQSTPDAETARLPGTIRNPPQNTMLTSRHTVSDSHGTENPMICALIGTENQLFLSDQVRDGVAITGTFYGGSRYQMTRLLENAGIILRETEQQIDCFATVSTETRVSAREIHDEQAVMLSEFPISINFRYQEEGIWVSQFNSLLSDRLPSVVEITVRMWPNTPKEYESVSIFSPRTFLDCETAAPQQQQQQLLRSERH
ncbi:MAG: prepilin-type N-terminal cleavage/methylation domain-containing protein [Planctomycetaceae bacterium]